LRKYVFPDCEDLVPESLIVKDYDLGTKLIDLTETFHSVKLSILLYPKKIEFMDGVSLRYLINQLNMQNFAVYEVNDFAGAWSESFYADGIHPSAEGASVPSQK
jgi:hypothetical protein